MRVARLTSKNTCGAVLKNVNRNLKHTHLKDIKDSFRRVHSSSPEFKTYLRYCSLSSSRILEAVFDSKIHLRFSLTRPCSNLNLNVFIIKKRARPDSRKKSSLNKEENQQQSQPTHRVVSRARTWSSLPTPPPPQPPLPNIPASSYSQKYSKPRSNFNALLLKI